MGVKPGIEEYLRIACQLIIDEFNETYKYIDSKEKLRVIANEEFSQADICNRIGNTFKSKVNYKTNGIWVRNNEFSITVHYLKSYKGDSGNHSNRTSWRSHKTQFDCIEKEIRLGNKGKNVYVIGWFNCVDTFSHVVQLGQTTGNNPYVNDNRFIYFPFLKKVNIPARIEDVEYNYLKSYDDSKIDIIGSKENIKYDCRFIGTKEDKFHFAIYY